SRWEPRAADGGRRRVSALGDVRQAALRTALRASSDHAAAPRRGDRGRHRRPDLPGRAVPADRPEQRSLPPPADRRRRWRPTALGLFGRQLGMQAVTVISISSSGAFSAATVTVVRAGLLVGKYLPYSSL